MITFVFKIVILLSRCRIYDSMELNCFLLIQWLFFVHFIQESNLLPGYLHGIFLLLLNSILKLKQAIGDFFKLIFLPRRAFAVLYDIDLRIRTYITNLHSSNCVLGYRLTNDCHKCILACEFCLYKIDKLSLARIRVLE